MDAVLRPTARAGLTSTNWQSRNGVKKSSLVSPTTRASRQFVRLSHAILTTGTVAAANRTRQSSIRLVAWIPWCIRTAWLLVKHPQMCPEHRVLVAVAFLFCLLFSRIQERKLGTEFSHWAISTSGQPSKNTFLPRDAMRKRGLCSRPVSVCPSVRLSVRHVGGLYPDG